MPLVVLGLAAGFGINYVMGGGALTNLIGGSPAKDEM